VIARQLATVRNDPETRTVKGARFLEDALFKTAYRYDHRGSAKERAKRTPLSIPEPTPEAR
jgi:hypothetical protein